MAWQIKTQRLAERCEICHQKDLFNANNNYCGRCMGNNKLIIRRNNRIQGIEEKPLFHAIIAKFEHENNEAVSNTFGMIALLIFFVPIAMSVLAEFIMRSRTLVEEKFYPPLPGGEYFHLITDFDITLAIYLLAILIGIVWGYFTYRWKYKLRENCF